jgi:16S rRNA (guanine527-N7)-methyltransferase
MDNPEPLPNPPVAPEDPAGILAPFHVSRETSERLTQFVALLLERQKTLNLIAPSTIPTIWTRHVADSLQLFPLAPQAKRWADLGSGGGFPGLAIACALADTPGAHVDLIESTGKKAAFLSEVVQELHLPATVHRGRIEDVAPRLAGNVEIATARAIAPLKELLTLIAPLLEKGAQALLLKGQDVESELTEATKYWNIDHVAVPSQTNPAGRILVVRHLARRSEHKGKRR